MLRTVFFEWHDRRRCGPVFLCALASLALQGCIRSKVTITSDPPKAEVIWRGEARGVTPITIPFRWYWYQDYVIEKEGYERKIVIERFRTPPWFLMPVDVFMEIFPFPFSDHRKRHYDLTQKPEIQTPTASDPPAPEAAASQPEVPPVVVP